MALIYAGIDEAGYGPLLGPLCVGLSVFHVEQWAEGENAPNLWKTLATGVCRKPNDRRRRIAIDDSKALKLSNDRGSDGSGPHPLTHLERGVLACLATLSEDCPETDAGFFERIGARLPDEPWYSGEPAQWPVGTTADAIRVSANTLRAALQRSGVTVALLRCQAMGESVFNELVRTAGTKAAATEASLVEHLWTVWDRWGSVGADAPPDSGSGGVRVVCDRQGGRAYYAEMLHRAFPGVEVVETHHSETQSRYELRGVGDDGKPRHMHILFLVESERQHLPVALASMVAKLTRDSLMARFNRHWCARMPELKPTAGYRNDAWRWLDDAGAVLTAEDRKALIRCS